MSDAAPALPPLQPALTPLQGGLAKVVREQRGGEEGDCQRTPGDVLHQYRMRLPQLVQAAHFTSGLADASSFADQEIDHGQRALV